MLRIESSREDEFIKATVVSLAGMYNIFTVIKLTFLLTFIPQNSN